MDEQTGGNSAAVASAPSSFEAAFAADASPASETPASSTDATAAVQPATEQGSPQQGQEREGFIPRQRFDDVNARMQQAEQWKQQRAWAEHIDQGTFSQMAHWYQAFAADPVTFLAERAAEMQQHPEYGPKLMSLAAKQLASARGRNGQSQNYDGIVVDLGNGQSLTLGDFKQAVLDAVEQKYAPIVQTVQQQREAAQKAEQEAQADKFAGDFYTELKALPNFAQVEKQIKADMTALAQAGRLPADANGLKAVAYQLYLKYGLSTLTSSAEKNLLDNLQQKAAAASSVNPGSAAAGSAPKDVRDFNDPRLQWR